MNPGNVPPEPEVKPRIMGGMFGLEVLPAPKNSVPPFLDGRDILLANARSGIFLLIDRLAPRQVWLPSYLCDSMLQAVDREKTKVKFYEMDYNLVISSLHWLDDVGVNDLVIFIDYFGFPGDTSWTRLAKARGAWILEDASQALLTHGVGECTDFVLFSPRKFLGVPDGGILASAKSEPEFSGIRLASPPATWWLKSLDASVLRREFDLHGGSRHWFGLFRQANAGCPVGYYGMSELSAMLLQHSFDYLAIARRRIENYGFLADRLADIALFPILPEHVVPLGFPIRVQNRDQIRQRLFENEIYPPIHWPIQRIVPEEFSESHRLAAEIMTLPCDQRYNSRDMERMVRLVRQALTW